ncbi:MAG: hypothetical protein AAF389_15035 [Gemmatimonadota bacterium]
MNVLDQTSALLELAGLWEGDAEAHTRYDPDDPAARVLSKCASDLRGLLGDKTPEWVPLSTVRATSGRSDKALRSICEDLRSKGLARKNEAGHWELSLFAAIRIPKNTERLDLSDIADPDELARVLGRDPG